MRFVYFAAALALFTVGANANSTGSPSCKADAATITAMKGAGKMGPEADEKTFAAKWTFALWDQNMKEITDTKIQANTDYMVTVKSAKTYMGVMVYPMVDDKRPTSDDASIKPAADFQLAKCSQTDGDTVTHTDPSEKDSKKVVATVNFKNGKKAMLLGMVVTSTPNFGKVMSMEFDLQGGGTPGNGTDNNTTDGGNGTDNGGGNTDNGGNGGNNTDTSSGTFIRPVLAVQALTLAVFLFA